MSNVKLRPYQQKAIDQVHAHWQAGTRNVAMVLPTGAGKSVCISDVVSSEQGGVCVIAHRQELVSQMSLHLSRDGIEHNIIGSKSVIKNCIKLQMEEFGRIYYNQQSKVAVAGVDTIIRRHDQLKNWLPTVTLWVIDEMHHLQGGVSKGNGNKWGKVVEMFPHPQVRGLGVTATPVRTDGKGLGRNNDGCMDALVIGPGMRDLINMGYLTDYKIYAPGSDINLANVRISANGEYNQHDIANAVAHSGLVAQDDTSTVTGDVVRHYLKLANGKLGVTFVPSIAVGEEITAEYNAAGVPAVMITAKTPDRDRIRAMHRFERREILQVVNVDILGEGVDVPAIEVVSMARPTMSFGLFTQQFGRALRLLDGKKNAIIIDHVGNIMRHGLPDAPQNWSLEPTRRNNTNNSDTENAIPTKACVMCSYVMLRHLKQCPDCGHIHVPAERSAIQFVDGDLMELDPVVLAHMRGEVARADTPIDEQVAEYTQQLLDNHCKPMHIRAHRKRKYNQIQHQQQSQVILRERMAWWAGYRRHEGWADDEIYRMFYFRYGIDWITAMTLDGDETDKLIARIPDERRSNRTSSSETKSQQ